VKYLVQIISNYQYIPVSNLKLVSEWYIENLGFEIVFEDPIFIELRTLSGVRIILIPNDEGKVTSHMNYSNGSQSTYGFTVSDIYAIYQQFKEKGIEVGELSDYQGLSFGFNDPDGNKIEIWSDYPKS